MAVAVEVAETVSLESVACMSVDTTVSASARGLKESSGYP